jgi:hypothetical protein
VVIPEGFLLREVPFPAGGLSWASLLDERRILEVVVVVPGHGAYYQRVEDGDGRDLDGLTNGWVEIYSRSFDRVGPSSVIHPLQFGATNTILAFDPDTMEFYSAVVGDILGTP